MPSRRAPGITKPVSLATGALATYEALVREQLRETPAASTVKSNAAATEARFMSDSTRRSTWLWFDSQGDAAFAVFGSRDAKFRQRVNASVYAGDDWRARQCNKWVFRDPPPLRRRPTERGWHTVRRLVKLQPVLKQWLERQYVPEGPVHSRFAQEAEDIVVSGS